MVRAQDEDTLETIMGQKDIIADLARLDSLTSIDSEKRPKAAAAAIVQGAAVYVSLEGIIDFEKETQRLEKEINKVSKDLVSVTKKLQNEDFLKKAPKDVVEKAWKLTPHPYPPYANIESLNMQAEGLVKGGKIKRGAVKNMDKFIAQVYHPYFLMEYLRNMK